MEIVKEFIIFLMSNKKYWLIPVLLVMMMMAFLIYSASGSVLAPFIYTIF